jgi:6-phosphogluconolactonase
MATERYVMTDVFENKETLIKAMVSSILDSLQSAIQKNGTANILLSGGSTPGPLYRLLDQECDFLDKVTIGLLDERYVDVTSESSNEKYIRSCFTKYPEDYYTFKGMVYDTSDEKRNLEIVRTQYEDFIEHTDVVILGMGPDGHTASIFPNDPESEIARTTTDKELYSTKAPSDPTNRITCSLEMITSATTVYLLFYGKEKWDVLNNVEKSFPIHDVFRKRDVKIILFRP